jgi:hypothetical protein
MIVGVNQLCLTTAWTKSTGNRAGRITPPCNVRSLSCGFADAVRPRPPPRTRGRGARYATFSLSNASALAWVSLAMSAGASEMRSRNTRPFAFTA